jgi:hypothetical protein
MKGSRIICLEIVQSMGDGDDYSPYAFLVGNDPTSIQEMREQYASETSQLRLITSGYYTINFLEGFKWWLIKDRGFIEVHVECEYFPLQSDTDAVIIQELVSEGLLREPPKPSKLKELDRLGYRFSDVDPPSAE